MRDSGSAGGTESSGVLALRAARAGVAAIKAVEAAGEIRADFKSGAHDLVTAADRAAETAIIQTLRSARPHDSILGEETGAHTGTSSSRWLIDPLDGTANFVYGRTDHAVSVAVEDGGQLQAGAIIRPADGRWAMAESAAVTFGSDRPDRPTPTGGGTPTSQPRPSLNIHAITGQALLSIGLPYAKDARQQVFSLLRALVPQVRGIRIVGSAACDLLAVAVGESDAFIGFGLAEWDTAAGEVIVAAAGGVISHVTTAAFDIVVAGAPALVSDLAEIIAGVIRTVPGP